MKSIFSLNSVLVSATWNGILSDNFPDSRFGRSHVIFPRLLFLNDWQIELERSFFLSG